MKKVVNTVLFLMFFLTLNHRSLYSVETEFSYEELFSQDHEEGIAITQRKVNLDHNPYIPLKVKKKMHPYVIPVNHPVRSRLDAIFLHNRVTADEQSFAEAGFKTFSIGKRSFVHVARHQLIPHYIVKAHLDNDARKKYGKESWEWIVKRCEGARRIKKVIQRKNIKHFVVADKWIYPLPAEPSPPMQKGYVRHCAILLATDMMLVSQEKNLKAWRTKVTEEHLDELYTIISRSRGSSYRPDNITLTKAGTFAFIDTEYPNNGPDYKSIRFFLNRDMRKYWDKLVKKGGPD